MAQKAQKFLKYAQHFYMKNSLKTVDTHEGFVLGRMGSFFSSLHFIFLALVRRIMEFGYNAKIRIVLKKFIGGYILKKSNFRRKVRMLKLVMCLTSHVKNVIVIPQAV